VIGVLKSALTAIAEGQAFTLDGQEICGGGIGREHVISRNKKGGGPGPGPLADIEANRVEARIESAGISPARTGRSHSPMPFSHTADPADSWGVRTQPKMANRHFGGKNFSKNPLSSEPPWEPVCYGGTTVNLPKRGIIFTTVAASHQGPIMRSASFGCNGSGQTGREPREGGAGSGLKISETPALRGRPVFSFNAARHSLRLDNSGRVPAVLGGRGETCVSRQRFSSALPRCLRCQHSLSTAPSCGLARNGLESELRPVAAQTFCQNKLEG